MTDIDSRIAALSPEKRALLAFRLSQKRKSEAHGDDALPPVTANPGQRFEPFPLTGLQRAIWMGRTDAFELGNLRSSAYLELECMDLDLHRLRRAWRMLIDRHEMLRLIVHSDGTQQILEKTPSYDIVHSDLVVTESTEVSDAIKHIRDEMLYAERAADKWPLFDLRTSGGSDSKTRLHVWLDLLSIDAAGISLLFRELRQLYENTDTELPRLELSYRDYRLHEQELKALPAYQQAREYWLNRLSNIPPAPPLPTAVEPLSIRSPRFVREIGRLETSVTKKLKDRAREWGVTSTALLLSAYAEVLEKWSGSSRFTINIPLFNRLPVHPQVDQIIGPFGSVSLLTVDRSSPEHRDVRARNIQAQLLDDLAHRRYDGVELQRELARTHGGSAATMPIVFTGLLDHGYAESVSGFGKIVHSINHSAQVWMDLHADEQAGCFLFKWDAVDGLFPDGLINDMLTGYCQLLNAIADNNQSAIASWLPSEQKQLRAKVNATQAPASRGLAHTAFQNRAISQPDSPAVIATGRSLSYGELQSIANRIGRLLREHSAKPDELVAVVMDKGWEQVAAVLGILESGAAYLPIDAELPQERLWALLKHGEARIILSQTNVSERLRWPEEVVVFCVDREEEWADIDDSPLEPAQSPSDLAYVIYTSGSTGFPKGVMIEHQSVASRMDDVIARIDMGPTDRVIGVSSLNFDLSVFDIFATLTAGATLVLPDTALRREPVHWAELMRRERITIWNTVPTFMEMLVEYLEHARLDQPLFALRYVMLSGDWIPVTLPDRIQRLNPAAQVTSLGGATETTVWDIWYPIKDVNPAWKSIPYGTPLGHAQYDILNRQLEPCPDWVAGELHMSGIGLARGYWRDAESTGKKFITHPRTGLRAYRSGDLGRYLPDGTIEFMGRADFQVKVQGHRIELGEIEAALLQHPSVKAAVVSTVEEAPHRKCLVGYVVPLGDMPSVDELKDFLSAKLASHMIPPTFVILEHFPLTPNGKVDRKNLPAPGEESRPETASREGGPSADSLERQISTLVAEVIQIPDLEPQTSLLGVGVNSIDFVRLGNRLESAFGTRPRIDEMFRLDSIRALAGYYQKRASKTKTPTLAGDGLVQGDVAKLIASFRVKLDPEERNAFKDSQPGIRRGDEDRPTINLAVPQHDAEFESRFRGRRSTRTFPLTPVPFDMFSRWLRCLSQIELDGKPKYRYASGGALYPNQVYLHVKPGRVDGVGSGTYYYHPIQHGLVLLERDAQINRDIHIPFINQPVFDEAAFSVFIVAQIAAIAPGYGDRSMHFVTIEAGIMSHLLETSAAENGIGLCQIGTVEFEQIRELFHLDPSHVLIHSLLGGAIDADGQSVSADSTTVDESARIARMAERIKALAPEQVQSILKEKRSIDQIDES